MIQCLLAYTVDNLWQEHFKRLSDYINGNWFCERSDLSVMGQKVECSYGAFVYNHFLDEDSFRFIFCPALFLPIKLDGVKLNQLR